MVAAWAAHISDPNINSMSDGESFDEYNNDDNSTLESTSTYGGESPRELTEYEDDRHNRGIAYQVEAASFGQEDDYSRSSPNISGDRYGYGARLSRTEGGKAADVPSVVSEQEVTDYCTGTDVSSLLRGQHVDLIPTENVIAEKEPGVDKLKQTTTSLIEKQKLKLQKQLGSYNNDKATESSAPMGKRKKKLTK